MIIYIAFFLHIKIFPSNLWHRKHTTERENRNRMEKIEHFRQISVLMPIENIIHIYASTLKPNASQHTYSMSQSFSNEFVALQAHTYTQ